MDRGAWWAAVHGVTRVGHDWATSLSLLTFMHWRRKWQPTPVFLPGESQGRGNLVATVCGVAQSWTRLKRLSSSTLQWSPCVRKPCLPSFSHFYFCSYHSFCLSPPPLTVAPQMWPILWSAAGSAPPQGLLQPVLIVDVFSPQPPVRIIHGLAV